MIVNDSKFNGASVFRALDLKILSVMKTPNQIVAVYKDIEKLDTQNPVIGSLSTQIESGKLTDKKVDEYLNKIQAIKDLEMAEKVKQLKDLNKKMMMMMMMMKMIIKHHLDNYCNYHIILSFHFLHLIIPFCHL